MQAHFPPLFGGKDACIRAPPGWGAGPARGSVRRSSRGARSGAPRSVRPYAGVRASTSSAATRLA
jgi:hypothetical protein